MTGGERTEVYGCQNTKGPKIFTAALMFGAAALLGNFGLENVKYSRDYLFSKHPSMNYDQSGFSRLLGRGSKTDAYAEREQIAWSSAGAGLVELGLAGILASTGIALASKRD